MTSQGDEGSTNNTPKLSSEQLEDFAKEYTFEINPDLTSEQRYQVLSLLHKYRACFARNLYELRRYPHTRSMMETTFRS
jgi:hypothetical protein